MSKAIPAIANREGGNAAAARKGGMQIEGCPSHKLLRELSTKTQCPAPNLLEGNRSTVLRWVNLGETWVTRRFTAHGANRNTRCAMRKGHPSGSRPPKRAKCSHAVWGAGALAWPSSPNLPSPSWQSWTQRKPEASRLPSCPTHAWHRGAEVKAAFLFGTLSSKLPSVC